ncbi:MAG: glycoside hydrolase family 16 protein, partial [Thermomicrobiales bacterium]
FWLVGFEDQPERSGEICVAEIFGSEKKGDITHVGMGIHPFRDPALTEEFRKTPLRLDVANDHSYAVDWQSDRVTFLVDGETVHAVEQSPAYPMQLMIGVFDFHQTPVPQTRSAFIPELTATSVRGAELKTV